MKHLYQVPARNLTLQQQLPDWFAWQAILVVICQLLPPEGPLPYVLQSKAACVSVSYSSVTGHLENVCARLDPIILMKWSHWRVNLCLRCTTSCDGSTDRNVSLQNIVKDPKIPRKKCCGQNSSLTRCRMEVYFWCLFLTWNSVLCLSSHLQAEEAQVSHKFSISVAVRQDQGWREGRHLKWNCLKPYGMTWE